MITLQLTVPSPLPLHANQRLHHAPKAQAVKMLRDLAETAARAQPVKIPTPTHLTVHVGWPTRARRDVHNAMPTIKACVDGIVRAGWLKDDDDTRLIGPDLRSYYAGQRGLVVLRFEFEEVQ